MARLKINQPQMVQPVSDFKVKHTDLTVTDGKVVTPDSTNGSKFCQRYDSCKTVNNSGWKLGGNDKAVAGNLVKPSNNVNFD